MSDNWAKDIQDMQYKFKTKLWMFNNQNNQEALDKYLEFRLQFLNEELRETEAAFTNRDAEEIVDGLIDLCVVAIGTLDAFGVDANKAWNEVLLTISRVVYTIVFNLVRSSFFFQGS